MTFSYHPCIRWPIRGSPLDYSAVRFYAVNWNGVATRICFLVSTHARTCQTDERTDRQTDRQTPHGIIGRAAKMTVLLVGLRISILCKCHIQMFRLNSCFSSVYVKKSSAQNVNILFKLTSFLTLMLKKILSG